MSSAITHLLHAQVQCTLLLISHLPTMPHYAFHDASCSLSTASPAPCTTTFNMHVISHIDLGQVY